MLLFFGSVLMQELLSVGLYIEMICLTGLFLLAQDENKKQSAIAEGEYIVTCTVTDLLTMLLFLRYPHDHPHRDHHLLPDDSQLWLRSPCSVPPLVARRQDG